MASDSPTHIHQTIDSSLSFVTAIELFSRHSHLPLLPPPLPFRPPPFPSDFPQSKLIPKSRFVVDAFGLAGDYSVSYFLSHFHSDHYGGLSISWCKGIIFCSDTTARLLLEVLKVPSPFVRPLPLREPVAIDGCEVILIDANHCPGAVQFLFKIPGGDGKLERYVHTGDFRFCDSMRVDPILEEFIGSDAIFLDTTYCNPKFIFPTQEESIEYIVNIIQKIGGASKGSMGNVLFLVATYVIGKEKILLEIASRCNRKIMVDARKMTVLRVLGHGESGVFTELESESDVHVVGWNILGDTWPYFRPNFVKMNDIMVEKGYSKVVGFVPTGWTYEVKRNKFSVRSKDSLEIHLVPYSEHSNYNELREYVKFLRPRRVVPTVGSDVDKLDSKHTNKIKKHFAGLVDEMANRKEFLKGFHRGSSEMSDDVYDNDAKAVNEFRDLEEKEISSCMKMSVKTEACSSGMGFSSLKEVGSTDLNDEDKRKIIQELRECLPAWVTQDQMLDLISSSGRNLVDAVSNFYERETEFCEHITTLTENLPKFQSKVLDVPFTFHTTDIKKKIVLGKFEISSSQDSKASSPRCMAKSNASPGKRKRNIQEKPQNRSKKNSSLQSSGSKKKSSLQSSGSKKILSLQSGGSKQSTITKFFRKASHLSEGDKMESTVEQSCQDQSTSYDINKDTNKIDRFIQIINGDESLKQLVTSLLVETNGDINMALDLYYANPQERLGQNEKGHIFSGNPIQIESNLDECLSTQKEKMAENFGLETDFSKLSSSTKKINEPLVSLPPEKYDPVEHACWRCGQPAPYIHLVRTFDLLEEEKGKIKATSMLCNMFRSLLVLSAEDVLPAVYLCTNKIAADHENMELNIGGSLVTAALEEACGVSRSKITEMYNELGDLGDVALACRQTQRLLAPPSPLLIKDVFSTLRKISVQTGSGSTARKKSLIMNLMRSCREKEMKFLVRNLRIGAMLKTVLHALAQAVFISSSLNMYKEGMVANLKEKLQYFSAAVLDAYNVLPNFDLIVPSLMGKGIEFSSSSLSMVPGIPIKPMLAKITNGIPQALKIFENKAFTCEYKYDGQRAQIHKLADGSVRVFSRNSDDTTSKFPDLINIINELCKPAASTFILDAEVVAVDRRNNCRLMSFQELSSRGRGSKGLLIAVDSIKVDICIFVFDIMLANGEQLLGLPLRHRRKYLKDLFRDERPGYFEYAKEITIEKDDACLNCESTLIKVSSFLGDALQSSCEGIMVKSLDVDAGYSPSKRNDTWLKVKRDYVEGLNDSLDLVPIGAWHGNGRKAGWFSPFLMACYNPDNEEFQSVCRVMSGFSDAFYIEMKEFFSGDKILCKKPPYYRTAEAPDMWFLPEVVWEIRGADLTVSPVHQAAVGLVHPSRGISIRFPRFIRSVRDRNPEECSTATDIVGMFNSQTRKMDVVASGD
ncbi:DNA ligase 6-like isoform X2 [Momordica charantia]|uniref:DNA ligase n=1 Tax=Momordica charantia TaxID=3673 RepID=A0A6J1DXE4_MOMCH|nr:DNA ligase 6-like isoform X2 [Momordica charantia]